MKEQYLKFLKTKINSEEIILENVMQALNPLGDETSDFWSDGWFIHQKSDNDVCIDFDLIRKENEETLEEVVKILGYKYMPNEITINKEVILKRIEVLNKRFNQYEEIRKEEQSCYALGRCDEIRSEIQFLESLLESK